jgi:hypothetical protein
VCLVGGVNETVLPSKEIGLYGLAGLCNKFHSGQGQVQHINPIFKGMMSRVHAKAGDVLWGKDGKAEKYIAFPAYIRESRWKRLSLVESRLGSNLRRNRFEGLPALSSPLV